MGEFGQKQTDSFPEKRGTLYAAFIALSRP
jgi:hypothetical protein